MNSRRQRYPFAPNSGFGVLEVLLTLGITSALAAVVLPSLARWAQHRAVYQESERVRLSLERSYLAALSFETPVTLSFSGSSTEAHLENGGALFKLFHPENITVTLKSPEQKSLMFYPSHTATPTTIVIKSPYHECSVVLSLRGRVRSLCT